MEERCEKDVVAKTEEPETPTMPPKVTMKRPAKKPVKEPEMYYGRIMYYSKERGYMGFDCNGRGYQVPAMDGYKAGDIVKFTVESGKVTLHK